jgi:hypothetical protein
MTDGRHQVPLAKRHTDLGWGEVVPSSSCSEKSTTGSSPYRCKGYRGEAGIGHADATAQTYHAKETTYFSDCAEKSFPVSDTTLLELSPKVRCWNAQVRPVRGASGLHA